jgi:hypothetical protein
MRAPRETPRNLDAPATSRAQREPEPVELEPLPPARLEEDLEEVGRPEGPLEERHVDPYGVSASEEYASDDDQQAEETEGFADADVEPSPRDSAPAGEGPGPQGEPRGQRSFGRRRGRRSRRP